jgi:hypothetical protein
MFIWARIRHAARRYVREFDRNWLRDGAPTSHRASHRNGLAAKPSRL